MTIERSTAAEEGQVRDIRVLLIGGTSHVGKSTLAQALVTRRPGAQLVEFPEAGHWIHSDPVGFADATAAFLSSGGVSTERR